MRRRTHDAKLEHVLFLRLRKFDVCFPDVTQDARKYAFCVSCETGLRDCPGSQFLYHRIPTHVEKSTQRGCVGALCMDASVIMLAWCAAMCLRTFSI